MYTTTVRFLLFLLCAAAFASPAALGASTGNRVTIPAGVKHEAWDALTKKYVDAKGLVAYGEWKANKADMKALDAYLAQFAKAGAPAKGNDLAASGINAYNAFAIRWILENYPTESIQKLPGSFDGKRHEIGGAKVALDDLEHGTLRPLLGYRAHAALVCCARSCPPLQRFAYTPENLDQQIDTAYRAWLARDDLNHFVPEKNTAQVSSIFKWFKDDFDQGGGAPKIIARYAPKNAVTPDGAKLEYLPYHWGLNDQGGHGKNYTRSNLIFDKITGGGK